MVVSLFLVLLQLNLEAQTEPNTWPMVLAGTLIAAVPSLAVAAVIAQRRR